MLNVQSMFSVEIILACYITLKLIHLFTDRKIQIFSIFSISLYIFLLSTNPMEKTKANNEMIPITSTDHVSKYVS